MDVSHFWVVDALYFSGKSSNRLRVKTRSITNVVAPRRAKRENVLFPVAVRRSKTPLLKLPNVSLRLTRLVRVYE